MGLEGIYPKETKYRVKLSIIIKFGKDKTKCKNLTQVASDSWIREERLVFSAYPPRGVGKRYFLMREFLMREFIIKKVII